MKIVTAIDSFKGSMTSIEAGNAFAEGARRVNDSIEVIVRPLADGGEGTVDALIEGMHGVRERVMVTGPFAGGVTADAKACNDNGIDAFFPIVRGITTLDEAMNTENAKSNMADTAEQAIRLIVAAKEV